MVNMTTSSEAVDVLFVYPQQGPTGIFGPSCEACASVAVDELNAGQGLAGRQVNLIPVDSGRPAEVVADEVSALVATNMVSAITGWHTSDVREAICDRVGGRLPYVYAALHEGVPDPVPGLFLSGETPANQIIPGLDFVAREHHIRDWFILGNDYIWPRRNGDHARAFIARHPSATRLLGEQYVPLGTEDFDAIVTMIARRRPDGLLLFLVGDDAVHFNRAFDALGLDRDIVRLSPMFEENTLLAIDGEPMRNAFAMSGYFDSLSGTSAATFRHNYDAAYGRWAPPLNHVGESCYEALQLMGHLAATSQTISIEGWQGVSDTVEYESPRGLVSMDGIQLRQSVKVARIVDFGFEAEVVLPAR